MVGVNTYGVPENYPLIPADAGCRKCHGTGYKKKMLSSKYKACKHCAKKYGTDVSRLDLEHLPAQHHHAGGLVEGTTTSTTMIGTTAAGTGLGTTGYTTAMPASTVYTTG